MTKFGMSAFLTVALLGCARSSERKQQTDGSALAFSYDITELQKASVVSAQNSGITVSWSSENLELSLVTDSNYTSTTQATNDASGAPLASPVDKATEISLGSLADFTQTPKISLEAKLLGAVGTGDSSFSGHDAFLALNLVDSSGNRLKDSVRLLLEEGSDWSSVSFDFSEKIAANSTATLPCVTPAGVAVACGFTQISKVTVRLVPNARTIVVGDPVSGTSENFVPFDFLIPVSFLTDPMLEVRVQIPQSSRFVNDFDVIPVQFCDKDIYANVSSPQQCKVAGKSGAVTCLINWTDKSYFLTNLSPNCGSGYLDKSVVRKVYFRFASGDKTEFINILSVRHAIINSSTGAITTRSYIPLIPAESRIATPLGQTGATLTEVEKWQGTLKLKDMKRYN